MQDKQKDLFESRFQRLKNENKELKEKLASQKKENNNILRSLARGETILNSLPAGLIIMQDGKIQKANDTILANLDYRSEEIIGADFLDFIHADERDHVKKIHKLWDSGRMTPDQYDACLVTSAGMSVIFEIKCKRIRFQNRTAFLLILSGLEERLKQEQDKALGQKAEAVITIVSGMKDKLGLFNNIILEGIKGYKAGLRSGNKNLDEIFDKLEYASIKAIQLTEALEIISGAEKDKPNLHPFKLNNAVKEAVESAELTCKEWAEARDIKIALKTYLRSNSLIEGDIKQLNVAIFNMIKNAMEAMPAGGEIHITTEDNNGDVHVYIQDSGGGMPDNIKDRTFDPFFTTKPGNLGLGLSISSSIIKRHGGDIEFTSRDGEGTMFYIRLPFAGQKTPSTSKRSRKKITDSQILLIQESDVAREIFSHLLKNKGCIINKAINANEGLVKLKRKAFDIVIADEAALNMKKALFIEKARNIIPGLPIALISGDKNDSATDSHDRKGADLIIKKPMDVNSAIKRILEILMNRR